MLTRPGKRKLAAPFILSVALLPACGAGTRDPGDCRPPECHINPPPPPPDPSVSPTGEPSTSGTFAAPPTGSAAPQ